MSFTKYFSIFQTSKPVLSLPALSSGTETNVPPTFTQVAFPMSAGKHMPYSYPNGSQYARPLLLMQSLTCILIILRCGTSKVTSGLLVLRILNSTPRYVLCNTSSMSMFPKSLVMADFLLVLVISSLLMLHVQIPKASCNAALYFVAVCFVMCPDLLSSIRSQSQSSSFKKAG